MLISNSATNLIMLNKSGFAALRLLPRWVAISAESQAPSSLGYRSLGAGAKLLSKAGAIAILGVLSGYFPGLSFSSSQALPELSFTAAAQAQSVGNDELYTYVRAAFEIEMLRRQTYNSIRSINNGSVPEITCNNQAAIDNLASDVAEAARSFCNQSTEILQRYAMSPNRFNQISASRGSDPNLDGRIRRIIQELNPRRSR